MPVYEYQCGDCGNHYEQIRKMSEADSGLECPTCKSERVKRQLSTFATASSGSGSAQMPQMGCGTPSCCQITGRGCPN